LAEILPIEENFLFLFQQEKLVENQIDFMKVNWVLFYCVFSIDEILFLKRFGKNLMLINLGLSKLMKYKTLSGKCLKEDQKRTILLRKKSSNIAKH
jgi:hypothetical protein